MREYSYQATDATIEALRALKAPWTSVRSTERNVVIDTADRACVRLSIERTAVEPTLEVLRIRADIIAGAPSDATPADPLAIGTLGEGRNDVVLFTGETWVEQPPPDIGAGGGDGAGPDAVTTLQFSGRAGQRPPSAVAVCTSTDAVVVASASGEGILIRTGVKPLTLEVVRDRGAIARFLVQRGYTTE